MTQSPRPARSLAQLKANTLVSGAVCWGTGTDAAKQHSNLHTMETNNLCVQKSMAKGAQKEQQSPSDSCPG